MPKSCFEIEFQNLLKRKIMAEPLKKHLLVTFKDINYVLGTFSFNIKEEQFIYRFSYPNGPQKHLNVDTDELTEPYDHITWHKNLVHMKRGKDVVEEYVYQQGPLICGTDYISPLMIETIKLSESSCLAREDEFSFWKNADREHIFTIEPDGYFSTILFLVPTNMPTANALDCFWRDIKTQSGDILDRTYVRNLCDGSHSTRRFKVWAAYDVLLVCSPYCQRPKNVPLEIGDSYRIPNYKYPDKALKELILHRQSEKCSTFIRSRKVIWLTPPLQIRQYPTFPFLWAERVEKLTKSHKVMNIFHTPP